MQDLTPHRADDARGEIDLDVLHVEARAPRAPTRRRTARMRATNSSYAYGLPFEALFAARDALFRPILELRCQVLHTAPS
jgi:hypothetical protein